MVIFYKLSTYKVMFHIAFFTDKALNTLELFSCQIIIFCRRGSWMKGEDARPLLKIDVQNFSRAVHKLIKILCFIKEEYSCD